MIQIYRANSFIEVIGLIRNARRRGTQTYSYRQLADKLGYRSPRSLAMVHKGQRPPSRDLVKKIVKHLALTPLEGELVSLLAERAISERKQLETSELDERIAKLRLTTERLSSLGDIPLVCTLRLASREVSDVRERLRKVFVEITSHFGAHGDATYRLDLALEIAGDGE